MLQIRASATGNRGVFSDRLIRKGEVIESCPILVLSDADADAVEHTIIDSYIYCWGSDTYAIVFGYGMLYNHSTEPNAAVREDHENDVLEIVAFRDIPAGEEIMHDYSEEKRPIIFTGGQWTYADSDIRL